jgi:thiosulfate/3-mercaptopyruvate sulfurtransferase
MTANGIAPRQLVTAGWLRRHISDADLRVIDFRWYLDGRSGREAFHAGHIPGAVFVDLDQMTPPEGPGRHPIPSPETFTEAMRTAGVSEATLVVAYDDASGSVAARLWWLLRHFGHPAAAVLDGGVQAWPEPLEAGEVSVPRGSFKTAAAPLDDVVDAQGVVARSPSKIVLDARAPERYRGETEPIDPRAGHIPGARSAHWAGNLDGGGRFLDAARLRRRFRELGVERGEQVIAYCGSGVNACHNLLALELAGLPGGRLYEGSWSDWSRSSDLPAATGSEP